MWFLPTRPYNPQADLLYVDAKPSSGSLDFTLTMASVESAPTTGTDITLYFTVGQQGPTKHFYVNIDHAIDGTSFAVEDADTSQSVPVPGSDNPVAGTFVAHVPRKLIDASLGTLLHGLGVIVSQNVGVSLANSGFIEQSTGADHEYRVGFPYECRRR